MTRTFRLHVVAYRAGTPIPWWGLAGIVWDERVADVYVLAGWVTVKRVGHELTHPLLGDHHPWWHFCLRVFHGFRWWWHAGPVARAYAETLIRAGTLEK